MRSIIPETHWAKMEEEVVKQYIMCAYCGPKEIPTKVFYIKGTSFCPTHTQDVIKTTGAI